MNEELIAAQREAPLRVTTASGRVVDLRDPANIRPGMVFWADMYFQLPRRRFTCGKPDEASPECWRDAHDTSLSTCPSSSAERFMGCDPAVASMEDVAEFGSVHTQEGLDAIAKDFGTEPTSLDEMRKRPILTVSGGRLSEEEARKIAEVFEGHWRGEYHRMVIV